MSITVPAEPEPIEIELAKTALIVVDMQNAFISPDGYMDMVEGSAPAAFKIIQPCVEIVAAARGGGVKIIYQQMEYDRDFMKKYDTGSPACRKSRGLALLRQHPELSDKFPVPGTWGAAIIKELAPKEGDIVIRKEKYDGFIGTNLDEVLRSYGMKYLLFIGTTTNICVESTIRHAFFLDYFPILISNASCQTGHVLLQEAAAANVRSHFGWVTTAANLLRAMGEGEQG